MGTKKEKRKEKKKTTKHPLFNYYREIFEQPWCPIYGQIFWPEKPLKTSDFIIDRYLRIIREARWLIISDKSLDGSYLDGWDGDHDWPEIEELQGQIFLDVDYPDIDLHSLRTAFITAGRLIINYRKQGYGPLSTQGFFPLDHHLHKIDVAQKLENYEVYAILAIASAFNGFAEKLHTKFNDDHECWERVASDLLSQAYGAKEASSIRGLNIEIKNLSRMKEFYKKGKPSKRKGKIYSEIKIELLRIFNSRHDLSQLLNEKDIPIAETFWTELMQMFAAGQLKGSIITKISPHEDNLYFTTKKGKDSITFGTFKTHHYPWILISSRQSKIKK